MPRGTRSVDHLAIPSMIVFNPQFPDQAPTKSQRPRLDKRTSSQSSKSILTRRRSTQLEMKSMRQSSFARRSIDNIVLDCIDTIRDDNKEYLKEERPSSSSLSRQRSRRGDFSRASSRRLSTRISSRGNLRNSTSYPVRRLEVTPHTSEVMVDGNLQDKCKKLAIVF